MAKQLAPIQKTTVSDAQLHSELLKLFESGNTDKGKCKEVVRSKWKLQEQRYYKKYAIALQEWQELRKKADAIQIQENATDVLKLAVMSKNERLELLTKIALGELEYEETTDNPQFGLTIFKRKPTPTERMKAIAEMNKMEGDYAAEKLEIKSTVFEVTLKL